MRASKLKMILFLTLSWLHCIAAESALIGDFYATSDLPPKPDEDGLCYTYAVQATDTCQTIAKAHEITVAEITFWNFQTYGWKGCASMHQGDFICLSRGTPPMPVALPAATCGPQVPGTARPSNYADLASLNPCPSGECVSPAGDLTILFQHELTAT
jgi:hypothetical protein